MIHTGKKRPLRSLLNVYDVEESLVLGISQFSPFLCCPPAFHFLDIISFGYVGGAGSPAGSMGRCPSVALFPKAGLDTYGVDDAGCLRASCSSSSSGWSGVGKGGDGAIEKRAA